MRIELTGSKKVEGEAVGTEMVAPLWLEQKLKSNQAEVCSDRHSSDSKDPKSKGGSLGEKKNY